MADGEVGGRGSVRPGENENSFRGGHTTPWEVREKEGVGARCDRRRVRSARLHLGEDLWDRSVGLREEEQGHGQGQRRPRGGAEISGGLGFAGEDKMEYMVGRVLRKRRLR